MLAAFLFLFALLRPVMAVAACLDSGDETAINTLFERGELTAALVADNQAGAERQSSCVPGACTVCRLLSCSRRRAKR